MSAFFSNNKRFTRGTKTKFINPKIYPELWETYQQEMVDFQQYVFYIDYDSDMKFNEDMSFVRFNLDINSIVFEMFRAREKYADLYLFYTISKKLGLNLLATTKLITEPYLEALRIKEENKN